MSLDTSVTYLSGCSVAGWLTCVAADKGAIDCARARALLWNPLQLNSGVRPQHGITHSMNLSGLPQFTVDEIRVAGGDPEVTLIGRLSHLRGVHNTTAWLYRSARASMIGTISELPSSPNEPIEYQTSDVALAPSCELEAFIHGSMATGRPTKSRWCSPASGSPADFTPGPRDIFVWLELLGGNRLKHR